MGLKGDLDSISLADIFQTLSMTGQEGTLHVRNALATKYIYFAPDGVTLLTSGERKKRLGDLLLGLGKISADDLRDALFQQKQTGALLGETLVGMGLVTDQDIENAVRFQIEEEIYDLFAWDNASFEFHEGTRPESLGADIDQTVTQLRFNVNSLIMEAARRADEWEKIEQYIPSTSAIFKQESTAQRGEYTDQEQLILTAVDGDRTVDEVVAATHVPRFDVCRFVARLVEEGKARRAPVEWLLERGDALRAAGDQERALNFFRQACEGGLRKRGEQVQARRRLAETLEAMGQRKEAGEEYKVLADLRAEEHDVEGAINFWQKVIDLNPLDLENKERLISVYLENRTHLDPDRSDVIRNIEYSLFKNGKALAMAFSYAGQVQKAREVLQRLIDITPSNVELRKALVNVHLEHDAKPEAVEELERIASYQVSQRNYEDVAAAYKNILKLAPEREDIKRKAGLLEQQQAAARISAGGGVPRRKRRGPAVAGLLLLLFGGGIAVYQWVLAPKQAAPSLKEAEALEAQLKAVLPNSPFPEFEATYQKAAGFFRDAADSAPMSLIGAECRRRADEMLARSAEHSRRWTGLMQAGANTVSEKWTTLQGRARNETWDTTELEEAIDQMVTEYEGNAQAAAVIGEATAKAAEIRAVRAEAQARLTAVQAAIAAGDYAQAWRLALALRADRTVEGRFPETVWGRIRFPYRIESEPAGARVTANDERDLGKTPVQVENGAYRELISVRLERRGYKSESRRFTLGEDTDGPVLRVALQLDVLFEKPFAPPGQLPDRQEFPWVLAGDSWVTIGRNGDVVSVSVLEAGLALVRPRIITRKKDDLSLNGPTGAPAVRGDLLVTAREDGHVLAFDRRRPDQPTWDYAMFDPGRDEPAFRREAPVGSPVLDLERGQVYVASDRARVHAIRIAPGGDAREAWKTNALAMRGSQPGTCREPVVAGPWVMVVSDDGRLIRLDPEAGELGRVFNFVAMPNARVKFGPVGTPEGQVFVVTSEREQSKLYAFDVRGDGDRAAPLMRSPIQLHGEPLGPPVVVQGRRPAVVVAVDLPREGGHLLAFQIADGNYLWNAPERPENHIKVGPGLAGVAVHGGHLYACADNKAWVFDLLTGAQLYQLTFGREEQAAAAPSVDADGHVLLTFAHRGRGGQPLLYVVKE